MKKIFLVLCCFWLTDSSCDVHLVTNTNDSGPGSFRQAILDANADPFVPRTIVFDLQHKDIAVLSPLTRLPDLVVDLEFDAEAPFWYGLGTKYIYLVFFYPTRID